MRKQNKKTKAKPKKKNGAKQKNSKKTVRDPTTGEKIKCFTCEGNHYRSDCTYAKGSRSASSSDSSSGSD